MIPSKLSPGDEIRVIAPATSLAIISPNLRQAALRHLTALGLRVTFGQHSAEIDLFRSSSIASRVADIHAAFADPQVKGILSVIGGYNSNQLLRFLDYDLIAANPKVLCGYSDITALATAIHAKTGLVTYSGPHFSTFGMEKGLDYTLEYFRKCLMDPAPFTVEPSETWSDDAWYRDQQTRTFIPNEGCLVIHEGQAEARLLGGNLCTLNLLQGTEYMPSLDGSILLLEDDEVSMPLDFDRDLQSLLHLPDFAGVRGLVIGRFQHASEMTAEKLAALLTSKRELDAIPVVANASFGHTTPQFTFPIGGRGRLQVSGGTTTLTISQH